MASALKSPYGFYTLTSLSPGQIITKLCILLTGSINIPTCTGSFIILKGPGLNWGGGFPHMPK